MNVDVAIIGAGPAGGMAACRLARTGLRIAILDKCTLPRHKACGGALPADVIDLFDWDMTSVIQKKVTAVKYFYDYSRPKTVQRVTPPVLLTVDRSRFDNHLIQRAVSSGRSNVRLLEGFHVRRIEEDDGAVSIYGRSREKVQADFVVAADGAGSTTAKSLGLNRDVSYGLAIDARVEVTTEVYEAAESTATFNFFCLPGGYGWIFPKNGYLSCGVGSQDRLPGLSKAMDDFLTKSFAPGSIRSVRRSVHPLPIYTGHKDIATDRVCLVGDAANLVDPVMGEGIRYALQSGALAADVITGLKGAGPVKALEPDGPSSSNGTCRIYQNLIHRDIGRDLDILYRLALPVYQEAPGFFYRKFIWEGRSYLEFYRRLAVRIQTFKTHSAASPQ